MPASTWQAQAIESIGEPPSDDPIDILRHVVKVFEDVDGSENVVTATSNVYDSHPWTGLTHGDLRRLLEDVEEERKVSASLANCAADIARDRDKQVRLYEAALDWFPDEEIRRFEESDLFKEATEDA